MSVSDHKSMRPGQGVDLERLPVVATRESLQNGSFALSEGLVEEISSLHDHVRATPRDELDQTALQETLLGDEAKTFRNSYASFVIEHAWPEYGQAVDGPEAGISRIEIDEAGLTSLVPAVSGQLSDLPSYEMARLIGISNQDTLSHFICRQFADGKVPQIAKSTEANHYYLNSFEAQTSLLSYLDSDFRTLPLRVGSPAVATASGSLVLRMNVFGLPNLLDAVARREGFALTNEQHRRGVQNSINQALPPFYLPPAFISVNVQRHLTDLQTLDLRHDTVRHNGNPDDFLVYGDPAIVQEVNTATRLRKEQGKFVANPTGCPVMYGRTPVSSETDAVDTPAPLLRLPRSLAELALHQLDRWYYPLRDPSGVN